MSRLAISKDIIFALVVGKYILRFVNNLKTFGLFGLATKLYALLKIKIISLARSFIPGVEAQVQKQIAETVASIHKNMISHSLKSIKELPKSGINSGQLRKDLVKYKDLGKDVWKSGKVSGAVYNGGSIEFNNLVSEAFATFAVSNPLHPEIFPGLRQMEAEIISMVLGLYNAPQGGCGSVTSGGTESILMTMKAHRDLGKSKGIYNPEIIVPITAHAAFDKGADYFNIKLIHVPVDQVTGQVDVNKVKRAINSNTVLIVGSAPGFPHGIIDPLEKLSDLAVQKKVGFHIDACLGGFLIPFMEEAGFDLGFPCDFRLKGVTSISIDTHKYAFAPKGTSVILYRSKDIRNYQYFVSTEWPGGVYASPTIAGSRPGSLIAACWTTLLSFGKLGYIDSTSKIISAAKQLKEGISKIPNLHLIGDPLLSVVAFYASGPIKTYAIADILTRRGWHLNILQFPSSIHFACTLLTVPIVQDLLSDIQDVVEILIKDPNAGNGDISAIYGTAASVPDRSIISDVSKGFLDGLTLNS